MTGADPLDLGAAGPPGRGAARDTPGDGDPPEAAGRTGGAGSSPVLEPAVAATAADRLAAELVATDPADAVARETARRLVESLGRDAQATAARRSRLLAAPLDDLARTSGGDDVTRSLDDLRSQVTRLDPATADLQQGPVGRLLGRLPGARTPVQRYFDRFEAAQADLGRILDSLRRGRDQLRRDTVTLTADQGELRDAARSLATEVEQATGVDRALERALAGHGAAPLDEPRHHFVAEDLLLAVRQRLVDLQQQLAVTQQAVLALEILVRNNRELARGVDRALHVTVAALDVAVAVAMSLAHQRLVLDKVEAVTARAPELVGRLGRDLRERATADRRRGSTAGADLGALRAAFAEVGRALDELDTARQDGSPGPTDTLLDLDRPVADPVDDPTDHTDRHPPNGPGTAAPPATEPPTGREQT